MIPAIRFRCGLACPRKPQRAPWGFPWPAADAKLNAEPKPLNLEPATLNLEPWTWKPATLNLFPIAAIVFAFAGTPAAAEEWVTLRGRQVEMVWAPAGGALVRF